MDNVVIHTPDVVGDRMAGPGIRAWHIAEELAKHVPTTLIAQSEHLVIPSGVEGPGRAGGASVESPAPTGSLD